MSAVNFGSEFPNSPHFVSYGLFPSLKYTNNGRKWNWLCYP